MKRIWKYALKITDDQDLMLPQGAKLLSVASQNPYGLMLWAEVDPNAALENVHIKIFGTGEPFDSQGLMYVGTFQAFNGSFIGHVYYHR